MKAHEFQAKNLFRDYGIPCPDGIVVEREEDLSGLSERLSGEVFVVKAQIHAGGRGKGRTYREGVEVGRGVHVVRSRGEAVRAATDMLGSKLVTVQTGPRGRTVRKVLVENGVDIDREFYLAAILDRETASVALMASAEGGTEIEEVARKTPERIHTIRVNPLLGYKEFQGRNLALKLGLSGD
ncbi:MAG: succinate--CoA ligase subunit beta, partial [Deltaproteobacteria bacterium]|nr:succinate--CoA ligase subunit beta [Deltaproteobacteria bacterium]